MISKKALMVGFVSLIFAVSGTATVLNSFGTISGTADVEAAVNITNVDSAGSTVELTKNTPENIEAADEVDIFNATQGSSDSSILTSGDVEMTGDSGQTKNFDVDLNKVDRVGLEINGTVIEEEDVQ